jgi:hypothetical protein
MAAKSRGITLGGVVDQKQSNNQGRIMMALALIPTVPLFAAAGYSLIYLLLGGGFGGAVLIFIVAKMLGK